jgi:cytochrome P450
VVTIDMSIETTHPDSLVMALLGQPADPYPLYRELRSIAPNHQSALGVRFISSYHGCFELLRSANFGSTFGFGAEEPGESSFINAVKEMLVITNPPQHTRLRRLIARAFQPKMVEQLAPKVQSLIDEHLDRIADHHEVDLMVEWANHVPAQVLCELLGIAYQDHPLIQEWSDTIAKAVAPVVEEPTLRAAEQATDEFHAHIRGVLNDRRNKPGEDLISALVVIEEQGDRLSTVELVNLLFTLLLAGSETTTSLLSSGMMLLLGHEEQRRKLTDDPGLMSQAMDEILRVESPIQNGFTRIALSDGELAGEPVRAGEPIVALLGAANRDDRVFVDPDSFVIDRPGGDRHLAFSSGIHACLGRALARQQGTIGLGSMLARFPEMRLADDPVSWQKTFPARRLDRLTVTTGR